MTLKNYLISINERSTDDAQDDERFPARLAQKLIRDKLNGIINVMAEDFPKIFNLDLPFLKPHTHETNISS